MVEPRGTLGILRPETVETLREARRFIYLSMALFLAGTLMGIASPERFDALLEPLMRLAEELRGRSIVVVVITIFIQNSLSAFIAVFLGSLAGIIPFVGSLVNGILLGVVISINPAAVVSILPHGVFELPAVFISWGLGLWRGAWLFQRKRARTFRERARKAYAVFFTLVIPLLLAAALIEGVFIALSV